MSSMSEDAVFKAILKNKPQQNVQTEQKAQARKDLKTPASAASSDDAMYKVLLKNKPVQQNVLPEQKVITDTAQNIIAPHAINISEVPIVETGINPAVNPMQYTIIAESINNLTAKVGMVHRLLKTVIVPVIVLILIVLIAILVKY